MEDAYVDGHQGVGSGWEDLESAHHAQQKASTTEEAPASQLHRQTDSACGHQPAFVISHPSTGKKVTELEWR